MVVSRAVVVVEGQSVDGEVVVAELAHKQMARELPTLQQRRLLTAGEIRLHLRQRQLVAGITMLLQRVKPLRLATGQQMPRTTLFLRQVQAKQRAMSFLLGRYQAGTSYLRNQNRPSFPNNLLRPHLSFSTRRLCHNLR